MIDATQSLANNPPELLQHLYGICSGIYIAVCAYLLLAGISHHTSHTRGIAKTFYISCLAFFLFAFYSLFFQYYAQTASTLAISESWFTLSKYATPIALAVITRVFVKYSVIMSYIAYELSIKYRWIIHGLYIFDACCLVALYFIQDINNAVALATFAFVPHAILATRFTRLVIKSLSMGRFLSFLLLACALHSLLLSYLIFNQALPSNPYGILIYCLIFAFTTLSFSFIVVRYGYDEAKLYFDLKQTNHQGLIYGIHKALENEDFHLVYQPQINLKSDRLYGLEALIRWNHPKLGAILPDDFIPLAEKADLIDGICRWVIKSAVAECRKFIDQDYHLRISINFSAKNLTPKTVSFLQQTLEQHNVSAQYIGIEITESLMLHESEESRQALSMLHAMKTPISLDDYGTGFSSLSYINKLALHEIKIDRSFVSGIDSNPENYIISNSTISMSKTLGLQVVAEGIETIQELQKLKSMNCDIAQGYYIAQPMPIEKLHQWLQTSSYQKASNTAP